MQCPVCSDVTLVISSREGVEIDHCPQCRGVWLDRGELDKIIERSAAFASPAAAPPAQAAPQPDDRWGGDRGPRWDDRDDDRRRRSKRRSFLEELFDFD